jgi:catechol 2,3-dioxygenase-like lactoylglutathione lyase family enzyme
MSSRIGQTTFDCRDAYALSSFWAEVLGFRDLPDDPNEPGDEECSITDPQGSHRLLFIQVPEKKQVKNRVHLDLEPTDRTRDDEIERVVALGATAIEDLREADGTGWLVLADPEGNEFCILRSQAERPAVV